MEPFMALPRLRSEPSFQRPFTRYLSEPSPQVQEEWMKTIAETGQPEICEGLYTGPLPPDTKYRILRRVYIDKKKRPNRDLAPCPMCTSNRFLRGSLVYVPALECASVIGRCCAEHADEAERHYEITRRVRWEEDYLLSALPYVASKQRTVTEAKCVTDEIQRVYRQLRNEAHETHVALRTLKDRNNARLTLYDFDEQETNDGYVGPAGFGRGNPKREAKPIEFGQLIGTTALIGDYKPVTELSYVYRNISVIPFDGDELAAIEFIGKLTPEERRAAVATLQIADRNYDKFVRRAKDCLDFFSAESAARLNAYGTHHLNPHPFSVRIQSSLSWRMFELRTPKKRCMISIDAKVFDFDFSWKMIPFEKIP